MLNELLAARGLDPRGLYSVESVAEILGLTPTSVRRLIRLGDIRALHRCRSIIGVTHAALDGFLCKKNGGEA